jgi:hypothetical protein
VLVRLHLRFGIPGVLSICVRCSGIAKSLKQDLEQWWVSEIKSKHENFSEGSPLKEEYHPPWCTCPE